MAVTATLAAASSFGSRRLSMLALALQLLLLRASESMGNDDSNVVAADLVDRGDACVVAASLREIKQRIRPLFTQGRVATNAGLFLEGLLGDEQRKTDWMRAEAAGDPGPWRQQAILGRGDWDADALRDIVHDYVVEHLGMTMRCW